MRISHTMLAASASVVTSTDFVIAADGTRKYDDGFRRATGAQNFERIADLIGPRLRCRIVERDDEVRLRCETQTFLDRRPRFQVIGKRDGAEVVPERRTDARGGGEHRRDAGLDANINSLGRCRVFLDRFEDSRCHREDARIAAGNDGNVLPLGCQRQSPFGARQLFAIVGRFEDLPRTRRQPVHVLRIAEHDIGVRDGFARCRRNPAAGPGPRPTMVNCPLI